MMITLYSVSLSRFVQDGKTALYLASEQGHVRVVQILIAAHAAVSLKDKVLCKRLHTLFSNFGLLLCTLSFF